MIIHYSPSTPWMLPDVVNFDEYCMKVGKAEAIRLFDGWCRSTEVKTINYFVIALASKAIRHGAEPSFYKVIEYYKGRRYEHEFDAEGDVELMDSDSYLLGLLR